MFQTVTSLTLFQRIESRANYARDFRSGRLSAENSSDLSLRVLRFVIANFIPPLIIRTRRIASRNIFIIITVRIEKAASLMRVDGGDSSDMLSKRWRFIYLTINSYSIFYQSLIIDIFPRREIFYPNYIHRPRDCFAINELLS